VTAAACDATPVASRSRAFLLDFARESDDADLRRLLRETPMPGPISVSLEREPSYFGAAHAEGGRHYTVCARDPDTGGVFAMGSRTVRELYVNGAPRRVGYLSQLRIAPRYRHLGRSLLRRGFALLAETRADDEAPFDLTTIVGGNDAARRLLESGLRGLPRYRSVGDILTVLLPAASRTRLSVASSHRAQFAPVEPHASMVWDQRPFKQIVVRSYAPVLRRCRWLLGLPPVGTSLPVAYWMAAGRDAVDIGKARHLARAMNCRWLAFGLSARHPLAAKLRRKPGVQVYESALYVVHEPRVDVDLDERLTALEVAYL